ncbi:MAG: thiamine phosphate synthase [Chloroflexi bacterium]|nr:thiamine phosphate synthase [Chloroflexota bacterium]
MINWELYVITDAKLSRGRSHREVIQAAIAGGATVVQYREKETGTRRMVEEGQELRALCRQMGVPFIVNDRLDVALAVEADGVHVGQDDMPAKLARKLLGSEKILGVSATNLAEAVQGEKDGADYLGVGPIYATGTKPDAAPPMGAAGLAEVVCHVSIPVIAIGGINANNVEEVIATGADGAAVISAIVSAEDIRATTQELLQRIRQARLEKRPH